MPPFFSRLFYFIIRLLYYKPFYHAETKSVSGLRNCATLRPIDVQGTFEMGSDFLPKHTKPHFSDVKDKPQCLGFVALTTVCGGVRDVTLGCFGDHTASIELCVALAAKNLSIQIGR